MYVYIYGVYKASNTKPAPASDYGLCFVNHMLNNSSALSRDSTAFVIQATSQLQSSVGQDNAERSKTDQTLNTHNPGIGSRDVKAVEGERY